MKKLLFILVLFFSTCPKIDFNDKIVQVKFADASKNKKLYKTGLDVCNNNLNNKTVLFNQTILFIIHRI